MEGMMYQTVITFPVREWRKLRQNLQNVPDEFQKKIQREITAMVDEVEQEFGKYPPPAKKPIQWTSARQRRAFFATNGFGGGIPYVRTYTLQESWRVLRQGNQYESTLTFTNTAPHFPYVMGKWQQRFHANTGWRKIVLLSDAMRARVRRRITRLMQLTVAEAIRNTK